MPAEKKFYESAEAVLPEYTDEALQNETFYRGEVASQLLRIPAAYRQAAEIEVAARTEQVTYRPGQTPEWKRIGRASEQRPAVIHEILLQLAAENPDAGFDYTDPPRFPPGTPEYEAYHAELAAELAKFAAGEPPYPYPHKRR